MSVYELKERLRDIPGIETLTMQMLAGRQVYSFDGRIVATDPSASDATVEAAIRDAVAGQAIAQIPLQSSADLLPPLLPDLPRSTTIKTGSPMTAPSSGFAASLRAVMDEARAGVTKAREDGVAKVRDAAAKLNEAQAATLHVTGSMAKTIEDEAAAVMSELGQISNDLGV